MFFFSVSAGALHYFILSYLAQDQRVYCEELPEHTVKQTLCFREWQIALGGIILGKFPLLWTSMLITLEGRWAGSL